MKTILDTNVIIAAFASRGLCHAVFELCLDRCEIILSEEILREVLLNLNGKIKLPIPQCESIVSYLRENCFIPEIDELETSLCRDKNDVHILGLAQHSLAEYIITGDKDLLDLVKYKSTKIITSREFWTLLKTPFPEPRPSENTQF